MLRQNAADQDRNACFVLEMHMDMSQEPVYARMLRQNAADQDRNACFARACAIPETIISGPEWTCLCQVCGDLHGCLFFTGQKQGTRRVRCKSTLLQNGRTPAKCQRHMESAAGAWQGLLKQAPFLAAKKVARLCKGSLLSLLCPHLQRRKWKSRPFFLHAIFCAVRLHSANLAQPCPAPKMARFELHRRVLVDKGSARTFSSLTFHNLIKDKASELQLDINHILCYQPYRLLRSDTSGVTVAYVKYGRQQQEDEGATYRIEELERYKLMSDEVAAHLQQRYMDLQSEFSAQMEHATTIVAHAGHGLKDQVHQLRIELENIQISAEQEAMAVGFATNQSCALRLVMLEAVHQNNTMRNTMAGSIRQLETELDAAGMKRDEIMREFRADLRHEHDRLAECEHQLAVEESKCHIPKSESLQMQLTSAESRHSEVVAQGGSNAGMRDMRMALRSELMMQQIFSHEPRNS
eukprot:s1948_g9.t1